MKPYERDIGLAQEKDVLLLRGGSATERNDARFLLCGGLAENTRELFVFDTPEFGFAKLRKNMGDGLSGMFDDALIEVHMLPPNLPGEQPRDGGLAAAHESGEADEFARACFVNHGTGRRYGILENAEWRNQSRLRILIVPSKDVSSTLARPALKVPNKLLPNL